MACDMGATRSTTHSLSTWPLETLTKRHAWQPCLACMCVCVEMSTPPSPTLTLTLILTLSLTLTLTLTPILTVEASRIL